MSAEQWRPVPGFEGIYEVSDRGQVRSLTRVAPHALCGTYTVTGRLIAGFMVRGYRRVDLCLSGTRTTRPVHQLVLEAFVGPRPDGMEVRHLDGDSSNNRLTNLAYGTRVQNAQDRLRHGNYPLALRTACSKGHPYGDSPPVTARGARWCRECDKQRKAAASKVGAK